MHGDSAFERLEAARFTRDSAVARQQALQHGVHTSNDPVLTDHAAGGPGLRTVRRSRQVPQSEDEGAFRAAIWLVAIVVVATAVLALAGRHTLLSEPAPPVVVAKPVAPPEKKKPEEHVAVTLKPKPVEPKPKPADNTPPKVAVDNPPPRALPVGPTVVTNAAVAVPVVPVVDTNAVAVPVAATDMLSNLTNAAYGIPTVEPEAPAAETAFEARGVAESSLKPALVGPNGAASLLKVIGRRTEGSPAPTSWTFYFYDTGAIGNASYRTVRNGRITRDGEALTVAVTPWHVGDIIPEEKLKVDSAAALAAAQALIPNVQISSSQFELNWPKDSTAPIWLVSLWAKDHDGHEASIGWVQVLADTGYVVKKSLNLPE